LEIETEQVFLFTQLNAPLDYFRLELTLEFTLKCSHMFRLTNHHQGLWGATSSLC
jgi:hypothetical protein